MPFCTRLSQAAIRHVASSFDLANSLIYNLDDVKNYININSRQDHEERKAREASFVGQSGKDLRQKIVFIFSQMSTLVKDKKIKDFSIQQASLEQVFRKVISS